MKKLKILNMKKKLKKKILKNINYISIIYKINNRWLLKVIQKLNLRVYRLQLIKVLIKMIKILWL